jgi:hypothetical protein
MQWRSESSEGWGSGRRGRLAVGACAALTACDALASSTVTRQKLAQRRAFSFFFIDLTACATPAAIDRLVDRSIDTATLMGGSLFPKVPLP